MLVKQYVNKPHLSNTCIFTANLKFLPVKQNLKWKKNLYCLLLIIFVCMMFTFWTRWYSSGSLLGVLKALQILQQLLLLLLIVNNKIKKIKKILKSDYEEFSVFVHSSAPLWIKAAVTPAPTKSFACQRTAGDVCICFGTEWKREQRMGGDEVMYFYQTGKMIIVTVVIWRWWSKVNSVTVPTADLLWREFFLSGD